MSQSQNRISALAALLIALLSSRAEAIPLPALNLPELVQGADLIAVARVTSVREIGITSIDNYGQSIPARRMSGVLEIKRLVKGVASDSTLAVGFAVPNVPLGHTTISAGQFGMFFMRKTTGSMYDFENPYYPFVVASAKVPTAEGSDLDRVVAEVANVVSAPGASVEDRLRAIAILTGVKVPAAGYALRIAAGDPDVSVRINAVAALIRLGDGSALGAAEELLLKRSNIKAGLLNNLAFAVQDCIKDPEAIPVLSRLLKATDVQTRRAGAAALRNTAAEEAIEPLTRALEDSDREVRYHAVLGLAIITGHNEWGPSIGLYDRD